MQTDVWRTSRRRAPSIDAAYLCSVSLRTSHRPPDLYHGRCPALTQRYWPTFYALYPFLQFLLLGLKEIRARFLTRSPYQREVFQLLDKTQLALDWVHPTTPEATVSLVCLLLHGVAQASESVTMSDLGSDLAARGWPTVVLNRRGYGLPLGSTAHTDTDGGLQCPHLSVWGRDTDVDEVIGLIAGRYPAAKIAVIGFSAGSALSCRYISKRPGLSAWDPAAVDRRVLCSVAIDPGYEVAWTRALLSLCPNMVDKGHAEPLQHSCQSFHRK